MATGKSIPILIHPVSSPLLKDISQKPEIIIAEVKEALN
jgi:hypothetical protein